VTRNVKAPIGEIAGDLSPSNGYWRIQINRKRYLAHTLAWFYMTGKWAEHQIDHINGQRTDNRFVNLRPATNKENHENIKLRTDNRSGHRGIHWSNSRQKWVAQICHNGVGRHVGIFADLNDAVVAVKNARDLLFTHHKTEYSS
jgi:hypothetical protein